MMRLRVILGPRLSVKGDTGKDPGPAPVVGHMPVSVGNAGGATSPAWGETGGVAASRPPGPPRKTRGGSRAEAPPRFGEVVPGFDHDDRMARLVNAAASRGCGEFLE